MARSNLGGGTELLAAATKKRIRFSSGWWRRPRSSRAACGQEGDQVWAG